MAGFESIQYDGACDKSNEILDSSCDDLYDLRGTILETEYPETYENEYGEKMYSVGGDFGDISETDLECFLTENPEVGLTPLGLADVLKNHPEHRFTGGLIIEHFDDYLDNCKAPLIG